MSFSTKATNQKGEAMVSDKEDLQGVDGCGSDASIIGAINQGIKGKGKSKVVRKPGSLVFHDQAAYDRFKKAYPSTPNATYAAAPGVSPALEVKKKLMPAIQACHASEARRNPGLSGKVGVLFELGPDGKVGKFAVTEDTLGSPKVSLCISRMIQTHQFAPQNGTTEVVLPFVFMA